jgi:hypothetical protein
MTAAYGAFALGAALLYSAFENISLIDVILGRPGHSVSSQGETHPSSEMVSGESPAPNEVGGPGGVGARSTASVPSGHGYVNPLPSATHGRIDEGVDAGGTGVIRAVGNARIVKVGGWGWPCEPPGSGVLYVLLDGPAKGRHIYVYEGIRPTVRAGQTVSAGATIGTLIPGTSCGIETGWADANGSPLAHDEYTEGAETRFGKSFLAFIRKLGY